uniref:E3 ubiquitin-protein ligase TRIM39-like n=1 Tax=Cyprinus carpio TaxID=7962 RepID=A0A8C2B7Q1_CYPCA
ENQLEVQVSELQCSVCLDVFTNPVTTPCGHNFCKSCLNQCWDKSEDCSCPFCKETFSRRPDLKINTALRQVVQHFKEKSGVTKVPRLKKHKLINAVENLEDYICEQHERPLQLFCRDDQTFVCPICTVTGHKNHDTIQTDVQQMIQDRIKKIQDVKHSADLRKVTDSNELFTALMHSIEKCQAELLEKMEEKQEVAEEQEEELIEELKKEITELKRRDTELEQLSNTEDHLQLIQSYPSMCRPFDTKQRTDISVNTPVSLSTIRAALTELQQTLEEKLKLIFYHHLSPQSLRGCTYMQVHCVMLDVTLDPDTAHPNLILSDDGKQVRHGDIKRDVPDNPERFDKCVIVLGKEGFLSGRFYFEVQVMKKTEWYLGVARESVTRKGRIILKPQNGYWVILLRNGNEYKALEDSPVLLSLKVKPQKVGVFVDYEEGLVSFYDVESRSHIYSFTGQTFNGKLYPYFCPALNKDGKNSDPLIISPVS